MGFPSMKQLFLEKSDPFHQHWTSNGKRWNVGMLYDYAKATTDPEDVPLDALKKGFENTNVDEERWSDEFVRRCQETSLEYPILVVKDKKNRFWIADGNHRYGKAVMQNDEMISAYIVDESDLPEKAIEPEPSEEDTGSYRREKKSSAEG
jgi:hypothetical protein